MLLEKNDGAGSLDKAEDANGQNHHADQHFY
jgi:hypothetical protein